MSDTAHPDLSVRHPDRRIARTRTAVVEAFTEQARLRPVREIAVSDLVEQAGIGRSTFYDHFDSIENLLFWLVDELVDESRDTSGEFQLEALLTFVTATREVTAAFLDVDSCAARCEAAMADAFNDGDLATRQFAAAGTIAALRHWLTNDQRPTTEDFVTQTCALVDAALSGSASH